MKRILIFIMLKLAESCVAVIGYITMWGMGYVFVYIVDGAVGIENFLNDGWLNTYVIIPALALPLFCLLFLICISCIGFYALLKANWKKAKELAEKYTKY